MKKIFLGSLSVVSLVGLVACGNPASSVNDDLQASEGEPSLEIESDPTMTDPAPTEPDMSVETPEADLMEPVESTEVSDGELEMTIQENLATLYPETSFDVTSEAGVVTIAGDIPTQEEADYIADWVSEMNGVTEVEVMPSEAETTL